MNVNASAVLAAIALVSGLPALAQTAPGKPEGRFITQPVRFIVPNAPGGPTDTVARIVAPRLSERLAACRTGFDSASHGSNEMRARY